MTDSRHTLAQYLRGAETLIESALAFPERASILRAYGYDAARIEEGRGLLTRAISLVKRQALERDRRLGESLELLKSWTSVDERYMESYSIALHALANDPRAQAELGLGRPRKRDIAGWLDQARGFYARLAGESRFLEIMARHGRGPELLEAEANSVESIAWLTQVKDQESLASTAERDERLRELDAWLSDLKAACRVALRDKPQELERLGIVAKSPRRQAKRTAPALQ